ncbi:MAG: periplasmic copper chaperone [Acetobacteraceae bacterium]|nr:periplasmic copper chaperone [Acetobacteraceae bacterium]
MRITSSFIVAVPVLLATAGAAFAHAYLRSAQPPVEGTTVQPPHEVTIAFTEAVEPRFSTIVVTNAAAQRVDVGQPHIVGGHAERLTVGLQALPPGIYTVVWHATSVDTHKTDGSFHFTVAPPDASGISAEHVWARATAGTTSTAAVYLTVTDNGQPDRLACLSTPVAATAELHETIHDGDVMKMRPVAGIALEPGKPVTFSPGGYHVMLTGLKKPLKAGDSFPLTLTFEHAQPITVAVEAAGAAAMGHDHGTMNGLHDQMGHAP